MPNGGGTVVSSVPRAAVGTDQVSASTGLPPGADADETGTCRRPPGQGHEPVGRGGGSGVVQPGAELDEHRVEGLTGQVGSDDGEQGQPVLCRVRDGLGGWGGGQDGVTGGARLHVVEALPGRSEAQERRLGAGGSEELRADR